ncbi:MAG: energy transducer TonB [Nitrospirales bacterium]
MSFKFSYTLVSLSALVMSLFLIETPLSLAQNDNDIEMLDIIEVPGTAVTIEPRMLSFPSPGVTNIRPFPDEDIFHISTTFKMDHPIPRSPVLLDPIGKAQGIRSSVKPMSAKRPPYPRFAREQGWHGTTVLRITVAPDGTVTSVTTKKSSGFPILDESANQAVKEWGFSPAKNGEFAVASTVDLPIRFDLDQPH